MAQLVRGEGRGEEDCTSLGWDTVNFPQSSWYGDMFWICNQNNVVQIENFNESCICFYKIPEHLMLKSLVSSALSQLIDMPAKRSNSTGSWSQNEFICR